MSSRTIRALVLGGAAVFTAACAEKITGAFGADALDDAFTTAPLGFESTTSSFSGTGEGSAFMPEGREHHGSRGPNGLSGGHDFMGGGLGGDFLGDSPRGHPFEHGEIPSGCTFASATGVITCPAVVRGALTSTQTLTLKTAAGVAQAAYDTLTNSVITHVVVSGSVTRRDSMVTTVAHTSDRTVTGLAKGSTRRTVNGKSAGTESSSGRDSTGAFTVTRAIGDTTTGIIVPIESDHASYPIAGSVIRSMRATVTRGTAATTSTRREVITYDGSATAKLVITRDGVTQTCTVALPHGRPACS